MASRNPSGWFARKSSIAAARDRVGRRTPLRLTELEERVTPYNTFYSLGEGVDTIWYPNPLSYSYSNLLDGAIRNGATPLTYTELTTAVEAAMGTWTAVSGIAFFEAADSGPSPVGLSGEDDSDGEYAADGHPFLRWGHHPFDRPAGQTILAHPQRPGSGGRTGTSISIPPTASTDVWACVHSSATHRMARERGVVDGEPNGPDPAIMDAVQGSK